MFYCADMQHKKANKGKSKLFLSPFDNKKMFLGYIIYMQIQC